MQNTKRIFDCFTFFNELELLKLRMNEPYDLVDGFVVCESGLTFTGHPKPLHFSDNRSAFSEYLPKIRHVVVNDMPDAADSPWEREYHQRSSLRRALNDLDPKDVVIISDADEIISPQAIQYMRANDGYFMLDMPMYQFYLNMRALRAGWKKPFAYSWELDSRVGDYNWVRGHESESFNRFSGEHHRIASAGWHFTFLGGADAVRLKLGSYSHSEIWQRTMLQSGSLERQLSALKDVGGGRFLEYCSVDDMFPAYVQSHQKYYLSIGLLKDVESRVKELEYEAAQMDREKRVAQAKLRYTDAELQRGKAMSLLAVNLALNKPATQSSISAWSRGKSPEEDAKGGNDGAISGSYGFHTEREQNPWWQVDLEQVFTVQEVRLFNRHDNTAGRLRRFSLLKSFDGENWEVMFQKQDDTIFDLDPYVVKLEPGELTRFIRVRLDGSDYLHFDECCIYGSAAPDGAEQPGTGRNAPLPARLAQSQDGGEKGAFGQYLTGSGPYKLEIGRSNTPRPTWLTVDLHPAVRGIVQLDATAGIPAPEKSFDYIYCEHMIEHVPFRGGVAMLLECNRILKPGGVVRIVTPSIGFLLGVISPDRNTLQEEYLEWSVRQFVPDAPAVTPAFFLNNFMRNWGHTFIYDHATLRLALRMAGFDKITEPRIGQSQHAELRGLEYGARMCPGYLELESMILEGTKS